MIDKNTVILSLKDYLDLIKENERLKETVKYRDNDNHDLSIEKIELKKFILKTWSSNKTDLSTTSFFG